MINTLAECRDFAALLADRRRNGGFEAYREEMQRVADYRQAGEIRDDISLQSLFIATVPDGDAILHEMRERHRMGGPGVFMEAGGEAVSTADFSNIMGQFSYGTVLAAFDNPEFIGDQLVTQIPADTAQRVMIPGVTMLGDVAQFVGEGEEYPIVGVSEQFIMLPEILKDGFIVAITEEAVREDKTGLLVDRLTRVSQSMALTLEKERLSVALGVTNTYSRNGGARQNTYANTHTNGDFDNLFVNPLVDFASFDSARLGFNGVNDPDTAEPIAFTGRRQMVVPEALRTRASIILNADRVSHGDLTAGEVRMETSNPIPAGWRPEAPLSNPWVSTVGGSDTTWWYGDFKGAFVERVFWPIQVMVEDRNSGVGFSRDIINRTKVRRKTVPAVREPRLVQKHTAT